MWESIAKQCELKQHFELHYNSWFWVSQNPFIIAPTGDKLFSADASFNDFHNSF